MSKFFTIVNSTKAKLTAVAVGAAVLASNAAAQVVVEDPEITVELPFDLAPIIASVLALAVLVLILVSGPRISLKFAKRALRAIGNIF